MAYVQQKAHDILPIPDKYNAGCDLSAITTIVSEAGTYNGIVYGTTGGTRRSLDFQFSANSSLGDTILIENTSFPDGLQDLNVSAITRTITFRNCFFSGRYSVIEGNNVNSIYENCTFGYFNGSNSNFYECLFGGDSSAGDGLNPYQNINLYNCFIYDITGGTSETSTHCDGIQIFGITVENTNIHLHNCRMEVPKFPKEGQSAYANACIMLSIEQQNASNISFEDCIINGGGYSIYVEKNEGLTFSNILFKNIKIGHAHQYGDFYNSSNIDPVVQFENISDTTKLIVGKVWKDESNNVHLSVTNDTLSVKNLIVYTNLGFQFFQVPACFKSSDLLAPPITTYYNYSDYPFDLDKNAGVVDYVVAFDGSVSVDNQIRFVNFTETPIEFPDVSNEVKASIKNLLLRRRDLITKHSSEPSYTPLEYLQSSGTQYIDTGLYGKGTHTRVIDVVAKTLSGNNYIFGASTSSSVKRFVCLSTLSTVSSGNCRSDYNATIGTLVSSSAMYINQKFKIDKNKNVTSFYDENDTLIQTETITSADFITDGTMFLFATRSGVSTSYGYQRRYSTKIYEDDVLVRDLIPVLDGSNVPCMYDKVSKTFFYNQGTGTFTYA